MVCEREKRGAAERVRVRVEGAKERYMYSTSAKQLGASRGL